MICSPPVRLVPPSLCVLALCAGPASAHTDAAATAAGALQGGVPRVEATLLSGLRRVSSGETFPVGVLLKMAPGWHVYWRNPGEAGLASEVSWTAPGLDIGPLQWPVPAVLHSPDGSITSYGYPGEVVLFAEARSGALAGRAVRLAALVDVLVCEVQCIPATLSLERELGVAPEPAVDGQATALLDAARTRVPVDARAADVELAPVRPPGLVAGEAFSTELLASDDEGRPVALAARDVFIPDRMAGLSSLVVESLPLAAGRLRVAGKLAPEAAAGPFALRGVLRLAGASERAVQVDVPLGSIARAGRLLPQTSARGPGLGWALVFAFLGGVVLNLMPCVFPVLALKAYGFVRTVQAGGGRTAGHSLAYTVGIAGTMLVLASGVLVLRAAGRAVGWGFQFQEPLFVAGLASLMVAFALNLFGVFRVGAAGAGLGDVVDGARGAWRSAGEGALAVVLATPCTAPLLGAALGFAFAAPAWVVMAVFLLVALGLALPFCALVLVPGLAAWLPRPGAWMERMRVLLGFALLGTGAWLVSVLGSLAGVQGMVRLLVFLLAVGGAAWVVGSWQDTRRSGAAAAAAAVLLAGVGAATLRFDLTTGPPAAAAWSPEAVAAELRAGRPVFVDFTADWCLTCKFNEHTVLSRPPVLEAVRATRTRVLVADWTRPDPRIAVELAARGRAGIPLYLVFSPHRPGAPEVLPELLTEGRVVDALQRATREMSAGLSPVPPTTEEARP